MKSLSAQEARVWAEISTEVETGQDDSASWRQSGQAAVRRVPCAAEQAAAWRYGTLLALWRQARRRWHAQACVCAAAAAARRVSACASGDWKLAAPPADASAPRRALADATSTRTSAWCWTSAAAVGCDGLVAGRPAATDAGAGADRRIRFVERAGGSVTESPGMGCAFLAFACAVLRGSTSPPPVSLRVRLIIFARLCVSLGAADACVTVCVGGASASEYERGRLSWGDE